MVAFQAGENHLRVVAQKGGAEVTDEVRFRYQTEKWGKPAKFVLEETARKGMCHGGGATGGRQWRAVPGRAECGAFRDCRAMAS